jgi:hypothetical protein
MLSYHYDLALDRKRVVKNGDWGCVNFGALVAAALGAARLLLLKRSGVVLWNLASLLTSGTKGDLGSSTSCLRVAVSWNLNGLGTVKSIFRCGRF